MLCACTSETLKRSATSRAVAREGGGLHARLRRPSQRAVRRPKRRPTALNWFPRAASRLAETSVLPYVATVRLTARPAAAAGPNNNRSPGWTSIKPSSTGRGYRTTSARSCREEVAAETSRLAGRTGVEVVEVREATWARAQSMAPGGAIQILSIPSAWQSGSK